MLSRPSGQCERVPIAVHQHLLQRLGHLAASAVGKHPLALLQQLGHLIDSLAPKLGRRRLEPMVTVMISPELRAEALQATALHELGHAFGLWGHSSVPTDALAVSQGKTPVLVPSERDRLTLDWVMQQTTRFGSTIQKLREPAESALPE